MSIKAVLILCAQALLVKTAFSQCTSRAAIDASGIGPYGWAGPGLGLSGPAFANGRLAPGLAYNGLGARGLPCDGIYTPSIEFTATSGGALPVTSSSAIAPTGITVVSENVFEGALSVAGELPFVGSTGMEGAMPSAGAGAINHACGDGVTAMVSEATLTPGAPITPAAAIIPGAGFGPAAGFGSFTGFGSGLGLGPAGFGLGLGGCGRGAFY